MKLIINKNNFLYVFFILSISLLYTPTILHAQSADDQPKKQVKYRKARALSTSTAKKMAKVYAALEEVDEKGEPNPDMETVLTILTDLRNQKDSLKSYDRSVMWNAWGYVYFSQEKYIKAIEAYNYLLNEPEGTIPLRVSALLTLGQLYLSQEDYNKGIKYILQWMDEVETVTAQAWQLLGRAYYSVGDYNKAISSLENAIALAEEEGYKPKESWYVILAASIGELKNEIGEKLGEIGKEFGTVTSRKRRCGWFDGVLVRQTIKTSGINGIALTKLDVLDTFDEIKICIAYDLNGEKIDYLPASSEQQFKVKPIYKTFEGWKSSTNGIKKFSDLPKPAKNYINFIEKFVEAKVSTISTSPERKDTILIEDPFEN